MNDIFSIKRFKALEKYYAKETLWFCFLLFSIMAGTYLVAFYLNLAENMESAPFVKRIGLLLYMFSPCLFEKKLDSYNSMLDFLLPSSAFEKYLHIWLKYYLITPVMIILSTFFLFTITGMLQEGDLFVHEILTTFSFDYSFIWMITVFQPVFFTGYFLFKKRPFLMSFLSTVALIFSSGLLISMLNFLIPEKVEINNWLSNPIYSFPVYGAYRFFIPATTFFPIVFVVALWITSYRLLKEKEI